MMPNSQSKNKPSSQRASATSAAQRVHELTHPVLQGMLGTLRAKDTQTSTFRALLGRCGYLMTYEILREQAEFRSVSVQTVLDTATTYHCAHSIAPVMILRAGGPFAEGGIMLLDELGIERQVGITDAKRVEKKDISDASSTTPDKDKHSKSTKESTKHFAIEVSTWKIPELKKDCLIIIYDPMLATSSTLLSILEKLRRQCPDNKVVICSLLASTYGITRLHKAYPDMHIYTLAIDKGATDGLNSNGFIVPGLGDAGDRAFGTQ